MFYTEADPENYTVSLRAPRAFDIMQYCALKSQAYQVVIARLPGLSLSTSFILWLTVLLLGIMEKALQMSQEWQMHLSAAAQIMLRYYQFPPSAAEMCAVRGAEAMLSDAFIHCATSRCPASQSLSLYLVVKSTGQRILERHNLGLREIAFGRLGRLQARCSFSHIFQFSNYTRKRESPAPRRERHTEFGPDHILRAVNRRTDLEQSIPMHSSVEEEEAGRRYRPPDGNL